MVDTTALPKDFLALSKDEHLRFKEWSQDMDRGRWYQRIEAEAEEGMGDFLIFDHVAIELEGELPQL